MVERKLVMSRLVAVLFVDGLVIGIFSLRSLYSSYSPDHFRRVNTLRLDTHLAIPATDQFA